MGSSTLSAVLEKHIRHLCLADFPCGYGSWRETNGGAAATEETGGLLDLLSCPHSPWCHDVSWSPQALPLKKMAVLSPVRLHDDFIYTYFTTLRIVDRGVSVIDKGLLKFSKLEELVLSANEISEIPAVNLPGNLRTLELRANWLSALGSLTSRSPPLLQYLGLGSNRLGSPEDVSNLTGRQWPRLVCLDLSDCEFQDQQALLGALRTLPCLRTLVLEGNPLTLVPSYPGLTVEGLPQLTRLDTSWISPDQRKAFNGLAEMKELVVNEASARVRVGRMMGILDPLSVDEDAPDYTYSYFVTYDFLSHRSPVKLNVGGESKLHPAPIAEDSGSDADLQSGNNCDKSKAERGGVETTETCHLPAQVSRHSTSALAWSECMDFNEAQTYIVSDLGALKKFFKQGLYLAVEEEKVPSWPTAPEDTLAAKSARGKRGGKGNELPFRTGSTKGKWRDKKMKYAPEAVQSSSRRSLGSAHIPLQGLLKGECRVDILLDLGTRHLESEEDKKKDRDSKGHRNTASSRSRVKRGKEHEEVNAVSTPQQPLTVELSVELKRWQSASEAHEVQHPDATSSSTAETESGSS